MNLVQDCVSSYVIDGKRERELRDAESASRRKRSGLVGTKQLLKTKESLNFAQGFDDSVQCHFCALEDDIQETRHVRQFDCHRPECDEYIQIFEYSNILVTNIYLVIPSYQFFFYEYIRTFVRVKFVCTNIFGHSLVSVLECKN